SDLKSLAWPRGVPLSHSVPKLLRLLKCQWRLSSSSLKSKGANFKFSNPTLCPIVPETWSAPGEPRCLSEGNPMLIAGNDVWKSECAWLDMRCRNDFFFTASQPSELPFSEFCLEF